MVVFEYITWHDYFSFFLKKIRVPRSACWNLAETGWKTLFWLNYCERKILFRLKKQAKRTGFWVSRRGARPIQVHSGFWVLAFACKKLAIGIRCERKQWRRYRWTCTWVCRHHWGCYDSNNKITIRTWWKMRLARTLHTKNKLTRASRLQSTNPPSQ